MNAEDIKKAVAEAPKGTPLETLIDGFFAGLEARTTNLIVKGLLEGANTIIDTILSKYGL